MLERPETYYAVQLFEFPFFRQDLNQKQDDTYSCNVLQSCNYVHKYGVTSVVSLRVWDVTCSDSSLGYLPPRIDFLVVLMSSSSNIFGHAVIRNIFPLIIHFYHIC